jgi:hypothetical protein
VIIHETVLAGLSLFDLRTPCDEDADFANPIEPSARGGDKIASVIACIAAGRSGPFGRPRFRWCGRRTAGAAAG